MNKNGSRGVLDFVRHDKTELTYVRLHSEQQPGRFALIRSYKRVFVGAATRDMFWLLLYTHGWQPKCLPENYAQVPTKAKQPARVKAQPSQPKPTAPALVPPPVVATVGGVLSDFTVFDTETTGGSYAGADRLLEIAAVRYTNLVEVDRMQSFVQFDGLIPQRIVNLTTITSANVRSAPTSATVLAAFQKLAGNSLLIGHNVGFDRRFVNAELARLGLAELPNDFLCTQVLATRRMAPPHSLGKLCERREIPVVGAHRAMNDVRMTIALLVSLHLEESVGPEFINLLSTAKPKGTGTGQLFAAAA